MKKKAAPSLLDSNLILQNKVKSAKATAKSRKVNPIAIDNRMNYPGRNIKVTSCTQQAMHSYFIPHHHVLRPELFLILKLRLVRVYNLNNHPNNPWIMTISLIIE